MRINRSSLIKRKYYLTPKQITILFNNIGLTRTYPQNRLITSSSPLINRLGFSAREYQILKNVIDNGCPEDANALNILINSGRNITSSSLLNMRWGFTKPAYEELLRIIEEGCAQAPTDYRILVNTANTGVSNSDQFQFTGALGDYSVEVYNSAGTTLQETITGLSGAATITIAAGAGSYELRVIPAETGGFNRIQFNSGGDRLKLIEVRNWGTVAWSAMDLAYYGCANLDVTSTDVPDLSGVNNMAAMFRDCSVLNGPANIGSWNTAAVTNMSFMFYQASAFNQPIGTWNTGDVTDMSSIFFQASAFNQPIGDWNTGAVTAMSNMFRQASAFNQPIGTWNTGDVTDMSSIFFQASAFNQPIGDWNTGDVTDMSRMFQQASAFNQPIGDWNTAAVTTMSQMFRAASAFNQPIGTWNTGDVTDMSSMFLLASAFNQPIGDWNTAAVTTMSQMFRAASAFNQPIGDWNTGDVTDMSRMFQQASAFNQPINTLTVDTVTNFTNFMLSKTAANYDAANLDAIYQDWTDQQLTPALSINFGTIKYTSAGAAGRNLLTRANATVAVTGAVANAGEVQITATAHGLSTGDKVLIYDVGGTTEANGGWIITVVDVDNFTLDGSAFVNTYTSGGTARTGFGYTVVDGGVEL